MAIENSPYISGLDEAIPANTDPRAEGAAQIRANKTALKNSFPNVGAPVTASAERMNEVFNNPSQIPVGAILMWTSDINPEGWSDCDGSIINGIQTPDLRGVFVRGVDDTTSIGITGGSDNPKLSEHLTIDSHKLAIDELPAHDHPYTDRYYPEADDKLTELGAANIMPNDSSNTIGSGDTDTDNGRMLYLDSVTSKVGGGNGHTHGLSDKVDNVFDNRPAFYTLKYICYVGVAP